MTHEANLAWDLVEQYRDCLGDSERTYAFVHLGAGEFVPVIRCVLAVLARARVPMKATTLAALAPWVRCNTRDGDLSDLFRQAAANSPVRRGAGAPIPLWSRRPDA